MPLPYYVSPEQMMKDKAEYARKGIARSRSLVALEYQDGVLLVAENPSTLLHKISEIYDRIAFAGVGKYNEFENLRIAGVRHADLRGYSYHREDVTAKALGQRLFPGARKHLHRGTRSRSRSRCSSSRWPTAPTAGTRCTTSSTTARSRTSATTRRWAARRRRSAASSRTTTGRAGRSPTRCGSGIRALTVTQNKTLTDRDLEVAVLDQKRARRKFRRVASGELRAILGRPDPPEGGRPMGTP